MLNKTKICNYLSVIYIMRFPKKMLLFLPCMFLILIFYSFNTENIFSKLKSLSLLLRIVDNYYVDEVELDQIIDGAMHGLLEELDPHSQYIPAEDFKMMKESLEGSFEGIGIEFAILEGYITVVSPIPDTPSDRAGLIGGDKIVKINGESAYKIKQDEVFKKLRGPKNSTVEVTISRAGLENPFNVTLTRDKIPIHSITASFKYNHDLGYIKMNRFAQNTYKEFNSAIDSLQAAGMKKIILDLRNNGGGLMDQAIEIVDMFINSNDTILFTKGRIYDANGVFFAHKNYNDNTMPIIVLINRASASASEIVAGAFQDLDRGIVVGETSFGKGLVQKQFILDDESAARITIAKYYTPSGRLIQRDFSEGIDEYYLNLGEENREVSDSLKNLLPKHKTKSGRMVYGGGGITPDVYQTSQMVNFTKDSQLLFSNPNRITFQFAHYIKPKIKITAFKKFIKLIKTNKINQISDELGDYNKFLDWISLEYKDLELNYDNIKQDWPAIQNRILAEIASSLWNKNAYYNVLLMEDLQFKIALENMQLAESLIHN